MKFKADRVQENIKNASTEDLLDRITVWQLDMEQEALHLIENELRLRGVAQEQIERHRAEREATHPPIEDTIPLRCSFCDRPAVEQRWGWHRIWKLLPIFPRRFAYCEHHRGL